MKREMMRSMEPAVRHVIQALYGVLPELDAQGQRLALALYRRLAEGAPVALAQLAAVADLPVDDASRRVESWPGVYYDKERRVIGFWGLTIKPITKHRLRIDGRELYAWCAWDTLFLPELLVQTAEVHSVCRASGEPVRLIVGPQGIESAQPEGMAVSFITPEPEAVRADVIANLCHYIHFFRSAEAAKAWQAEHPQGFVLTLAEAYEVGRRVNRRRYPHPVM